MRFRLAKKILRGLYREHIPYTIDQIDSAHRRMRKVFRYWHRGYWDRDYWCTVEPKGWTPRLHSPIEQRILEYVFEKEGGWDGLPAPEDLKTLPPIPATAILVQPEVHLATVTITDDTGVWTTTGTFEVRRNQEAGTLDFTQTQPEHKEPPDAIQ